MTTAKVRFKTKREIALENDIALACPRLQLLRQHLKNHVASASGHDEYKRVSFNLEKLEEIMAILDVPYFVSEKDLTYHE